MRKKISLRYKGHCKSCGKELPAGSDAYYAGRRMGVFCYPSCSPDSQPLPVPENKDRRVSFDFSEIKRAYWDISQDAIVKVADNRERLSEQRVSWSTDSGFYGCNAEEMNNYLVRGFPVEGLNSVDMDLLPTRKRRRVIFGEDGELDIDLALSGFDYPFLEWEKRERKPGMRVDIGMDFNAHVPADVIVQYQKWAARLLYTIEEIGYDLEVNLILRTLRSWKGLPPNDIYTVAIKVKKENEASDFSQWSAALSPGGFRHLGFLSIILAGERMGKGTQIGLGSAVPSAWGAEFSSETRTLTIRQGNDGMPFPEAMMTEKLSALLEQAKR